MDQPSEAKTRKPRVKKADKLVQMTQVIIQDPVLKKVRDTTKIKEYCKANAEAIAERLKKARQAKANKRLDKIATEIKSVTE